MSLAAKLQLRQTQSLIMTPQLMQSIRLLQLTHIELERFVDEEIERNPLLERVDPAEDSPVETEGGAPEAVDKEAEWFAEDGRALDARAMAAEFDASLENIFPDEPGTTQPVGPDLTMQWKSAAGSASPGFASEGFELEDVTAAPRTLRGHIAEQISLGFADPVARLIASELADGLDETG